MAAPGADFKNMEVCQEAAFMLGLAHLTGSRIKRDETAAIKWLKASAKMKHPEALCYLGYCALHGEGMEKNESIASDCFRDSAEGGSSLGQYYYAICLIRGLGLELNVPRALIWLRKSAEQGNEGAIEMLDSNDIKKLIADQEKLAAAAALVKAQRRVIKISKEPKKTAKRTSSGELLSPKDRKKKKKARKLRESTGSAVEHPVSSTVFDRLKGLVYQQNPSDPNSQVAFHGQSSKYKGVGWHKRSNRWQAMQKGKHLGYYNVEEAAAVAYDIEGRKHGMSHLNFPLYDNENFALDESDRTDLSIEVAEIYPELMMYVKGMEKPSELPPKAASKPAPSAVLKDVEAEPHVPVPSSHSVTMQQDVPSVSPFSQTALPTEPSTGGTAESSPSVTDGPSEVAANV